PRGRADAVRPDRLAGGERPLARSTFRAATPARPTRQARSPTVTLLAHSLSQRDRRLNRLSPSQSTLHLLPGRPRGHALKLPKEVCRKRLPRHRRTSLQRRAQVGRHVPNLDGPVHAKSVRSCKVHVKDPKRSCNRDFGRIDSFSSPSAAEPQTSERVSGTEL